MKNTFSKFASVVLVVAFLASALLISIRTSSSASNYDPWYDINGDGVINIKDATLIGMSWQAMGDTTKNVNVTNYPSYKVVSLGVVTLHGNYDEVRVSGVSGGFSRVSFFLEVVDWYKGTFAYSQSVGIAIWNWDTDKNLGGAYLEEPSAIINGFTRTSDVTAIGGITTTVPNPLLIETKAPYFSVDLWATTTSASAWITYEAFVYLRNE